MGFPRIDVLANSAIALAALVAAFSLLRREFSATESRELQPIAASEPIPGWRDLLQDSISHHRGKRGGAEVIAFVDLECP